MDDQRLDSLIRSAGARLRPSSAFEEELLLRVQSEYVIVSERSGAELDPPSEPNVLDLRLAPDRPARRPSHSRIMTMAAAAFIVAAVAALVVVARDTDEPSTAVSETEPTATTPATPISLPVVGTDATPAPTSPSPTSIPPADPAVDVPPAVLARLGEYCAAEFAALEAVAAVTHNYGDQGENQPAALALLRSWADELAMTVDDLGDAGVDVAVVVTDLDGLDSRLARLEADADAGRLDDVRGSLPALARELVDIVAAVPGFDVSECSSIDSEEDPP